MVTRHRVTLLVLYVSGLLVLTLAPVPSVVDRLASVRGLDKIVHFALFAGLAALLYWYHLPSQTPTLLRVVGPSAFLAALVEMLQAPLPYRSADFWDFFWGSLGALVAYAVVSRINWKWGTGKEEGGRAMPNP
jgi:VanZ family protein